MILKISHQQLQHVLDEYLVAATSAYMVDQWYEKLHVGKCVFSLKTGKKRKLLPGRIVEIGYEAGGHNHPGYEIRKFIPNNPDKLKGII